MSSPTPIDNSNTADDISSPSSSDASTSAAWIPLSPPKGEEENGKGGRIKKKTVTKMIESTRERKKVSSRSAQLAAKGDAEESLPITSWKVGLQQKASPTSLDAWIAMSLTLDGRDKITKLLQYLGRLLGWVYKADGSNRAIRWLAFSKHLSASRKAFRLGRSVVELEKLHKMGIVSSLYHSLLPGVTAKAKSLSWKSLCSAIKIVGTLGFWTADNISFLSAAGVLDDYTRPDRMAQRKALQRSCLLFANRSYFGGSLAGLCINFWAYWNHRHCDVKEAQQRVQQVKTRLLQEQRKQEEDAGNREASLELQRAKDRLHAVHEKQFTLFLALFKSCCDVMVFSNNTGIDLFQKYLTRNGTKLNEGIHCLGGMTSAAVMLYSNYPNANSSSNKK